MHYSLFLNAEKGQGAGAALGYLLRHLGDTFPFFLAVPSWCQTALNPAGRVQRACPPACLTSPWQAGSGLGGCLGLTSSCCPNATQSFLPCLLWFYVLPQLVNVLFGTSTNRHHTNRRLTGNDLSRTTHLCVQQGEMSYKQNSVFTEGLLAELVFCTTAELHLDLALSGCCSFNHRMLSF